MPLLLTVPDLACSACVANVTQAVQAVDASAQVTADPKTKQVSIVSTAAVAAIESAIAQAGYTVAERSHS
ncbi:MAG: heavy-metal-associated domain-containing protein [Spirulinaceae cyanobacterium RM2_2_10]|nr:heavy-metal-associated domain-containing protein [Spirulinaceae cyanobacterium SM2_1_0]NJO18935.1 heavy-metal-associated domain-containing protein [Spirulinaceae cyanobacterium RM2_2_10]